MAMDPEWKAKWVEALRSNNYSQANGLLRSHKGALCCLGVLAEIQGATWSSDEEGWRCQKPLIDGVTASRAGDDRLADEFACGLTYGEQVALSRMNDGGANFAEIADHIEQNM